MISLDALCDIITKHIQPKSSYLFVLKIYTAIVESNYVFVFTVSSLKEVSCACNFTNLNNVQQKKATKTLQGASQILRSHYIIKHFGHNNHYDTK